jgi:hypothetical protein
VPDVIDASKPEVIDDAQPVKIEYPMLEYPKKIQSLNLDKVPEFTCPYQKLNPWSSAE